MLRIGIDIGGTFTDFAAWRGQAGDTASMSFKVPSTPPRYAEGFKAGFEEVLRRMRPEPDEPVYVIHGTTVSTNTVIERSGALIALLVTAGFKDLLELQRMRLRRPMQLFETRPRPLVPRRLVFEIAERLGPDGAVRTKLDVAQAVEAARAAQKAGAVGVAVAFLHSYRNPVHERAVRDAIQAALPGLDVSLSSEIWPRVGEYERAVVGVLNAYVKPRMGGYLGEIEDYLTARVPGSRLFVTRSNGGAMGAKVARETPVHSLLSGPSAGVTAVHFIGRAVGDRHYLTMDMGGTSTDLSLISGGRPTVSNDAEVGDFPLLMPVTGIEAIGAGGGSIAEMDGSLLRVGPRSAGASPGPACFGRGGTLPTVTDAYLLCGYLNPANFLGGRMTLDAARAEAAMRPIAQALGTDTLAAAEACIAVATSNMVASVLPYLARKGTDPEDVTLVVYGGNGALHGPLLASEIGIRRVLVPASPSVLCAFGGLVSELVNDQVATVHGTKMTSARLVSVYRALEESARAWLADQVPASSVLGVRFEHWAEMRYRGQSFQVDVPIPADAAASGDLAAAEGAFHREYERLYANSEPGAPVEYIELRLRIMGALPAPDPDTKLARTADAGDALTGRRSLRLGGRAHADVKVLDRWRLEAGRRLSGPALIEQDDATILVPPDFTAEVAASGNILLTRG